MSSSGVASNPAPTWANPTPLSPEPGPSFLKNSTIAFLSSSPASLTLADAKLIGTGATLTVSLTSLAGDMATSGLHDWPCDPAVIGKLQASSLLVWKDLWKLVAILLWRELLQSYDS